MSPNRHDPSQCLLLCWPAYLHSPKPLTPIPGPRSIPMSQLETHWSPYCHSYVCTKYGRRRKAGEGERESKRVRWRRRGLSVIQLCMWSLWCIIPNSIHLLAGPFLLYCILCQLLTSDKVLNYDKTFLTLRKHAPVGYCIFVLCVCLSVCLSMGVNLQTGTSKHLTEGTSGLSST